VPHNYQGPVQLSIAQPVLCLERGGEIGEEENGHGRGSGVEEEKKKRCIIK
jgi:hypothetical protein